MIGLFAAFPAGSSVVQPDDGPYSRLPSENIQLIYDSSVRDLVPQIMAYMQTIRKLYDASFAWRLDEREDLILTSPRQQVANAYATVIPNIKTVWFPSGPIMLEQMAEPSWFLTLATHETAHLYQLNAKSELPAAVHSLLGNSLAVVPFVWPFFVQPNILTPGFLVEGNAVLNESRANLGGRLHSGEVRALVFAQIKDKQINPTRLINREWRYPYGSNVYYQGGYFQAHLAAKHGVDKTNQFFLAQGEHYLWPLILNKTFRDHFGASYPLEIREYTRGLEGLARNQKPTTGRLLTEAEFISPLNHDGKRIFYLSTDGNEPSRLTILNKSDLRRFQDRYDIPMGKPFWDGDTLLTVASEQHDLHHIEYSLYGDGHAFDPRYRGQVVSDQRAGKTASVDAANAWVENHVLLNGEPYDVAHSLPILDDAGSVYYFRQNGTERMLYKNRLPIFKYDGFYGKLMEVAADGSVYFIANTDYGSTLYQYKDQEIVRVLESDRVVDARSIDGNRFVATEVYSDGHRVFITEAKRQPARPAVYSYGFSSYNLIPERVDPEQVRTEERGYNSLRTIRYSGTELISSWDSANGFGFYFASTFTDPLQYQQFALGAAGTETGSQDFFAQWAFTKYLPQFQARYVYEKEIWHQHNLKRRVNYNQQVAVGMSLPLLRWQRWDAGWDFFPMFGVNQDHNDPSAPTTQPSEPESAETYGAFNSVTVQFNETADPGLSFYPWREFVFNFQNKLESAPGSWMKKYNTSMVQLKYQHSFPWQMSATLSGQLAWAENHDVKVDYETQPIMMDIRIPRLVPHDPYTAKTASAARFEFGKAFRTPLYSARIPVGFERAAPFLIAQGIFLDDAGERNGGYPANIFEWGFGVDVQILLFHSAPAKIRYVNAYDTRHPMTKEESSHSLKLEMNF